MDKKSWKTVEGERLAQAVYSRLATGRGLDDLSLDEHDGRLDLRGFPMPDEQARQAMADKDMISPDQVEMPPIKDFVFADLDFGAADFGELYLFDGEMRNCVFDKARFRDLRLWNTKIQGCSFRAARLPDAVLGALKNGVPNEYVGVDFSGADLRRLSCRYGRFTDIDFSNAKLVDIDFYGSTFTRCVFAGMLDKVIFWDRPPNGELADENDMEDVDFSRAELRWVEFRGLGLDRVTPPVADANIVLQHYQCVLERAIDRLAGASHYAAVFNHQRRWSHSQRDTGIWHRDELGQTEQEQEVMIALLRQIERECAG